MGSSSTTARMRSIGQVVGGRVGPSAACTNPDTSAKIVKIKDLRRSVEGSRTVRMLASRR